MSVLWYAKDNIHLQKRVLFIPFINFAVIELQINGCLTQTVRSLMIIK